MQISDQTVWGLIAVAGSIVLWLTTLERRLNSRMTRREHKEICTDRSELLEKTLHEIKDEVLRNRDESSRGRHAMRDEFVKLALRVERLSTQVEAMDIFPSQRRSGT